MLTKRKKQDIWLTQTQYDALQALEDGVVYHITDAKVDYSTEVSKRPILKTDNTTAQATSASETITGTINLHKVAKTGTYTDLLSKPTLGTAAAKDAGTQNGVADLDASGKVPFNELPLDALTGSSTPTTSTAADYVGQWYLDTTNNKTYQCTAITSDGGNPPTYTYTWVQIIKVDDVAATGVYGVIKLGDSASAFVNNAYVGLMLREPSLGDLKAPRGAPASQQTILLQDISTAVKYALCGSDRIGYYNDVQNTGSETNSRSSPMTAAEQGNALSVLGASQLVGSVKLTQAASSIELNNLDINSDGGIYDIVIIGETSAQDVMGIRINNITTGYYGTSVAFSESGVASGKQTNNNSKLYFTPINAKTKVITLVLSDGKAEVSSYGGTVIGGFPRVYIGFGYPNTIVSNITSITILTDNATFNVNTEVKVYKRATNAQTRPNV